MCSVEWWAIVFVVHISSVDVKQLLLTYTYIFWRMNYSFI